MTRDEIPRAVAVIAAGNVIKTFRDAHREEPRTAERAVAEEIERWIRVAMETEATDRQGTNRAPG